MARFVGREQEIAALTAICARALPEGRAAATIVGEPGSGKSRLLSEIRMEGVPSLETMGYEPARDVPLAAAVPVLRALVEGSEPGRRLEALLFEGGDAQPLRVFEAAHRALVAHGPALVVIDDLQWADELSLSLLQYLIRSQGAGLAILAAGRPSESVRGFADAAGRALGDGSRLLELGPLARDDGVALARALDPSLAGEAAAELWRRAGGSPFWLEVLAGLPEPGEELGRVIADRLRGASPDAGELLALLQVAARPLARSEGGALLGWPEARLERAAEELSGRGLIVRAGAAMRVAHDLIREAVEGQIPEATRRELHRRLAEWLEGEADLGMMLEALEHRRAGGMALVDPAIAIARSPRRRLLGAEGAARLAAIAAELEPAESLPLERELAALAEEIGEDEDAFRLWSSVASRATDARDCARAHLRASRAALRLGRAEDARAASDRSREGVGADVALVVELDVQDAAILRGLEHRSEEAYAIVAAAVDTARGLGGPDGDAALRRALDEMIEASLFRNDFEGLRDAARELAEAARDEDEALALRASFWEGFALASLARTEEAHHRLRETQERARLRVFPGLVLEFGWFLMVASIGWGRLAEARALAAEGAALRRRAGGIGPAYDAWPHVIDLSIGEWRDAAEGIREALAVEEDPHYRILPSQALILALVRLDPDGSTSEARERLLRTRADADEGGCSRCRGEFLLRGSVAWTLMDDPRTASGWIEEWEATGRSGSALDVLNHEQATATLAASAGKPTVALEAAAARADEMLRPMEAVWARLDLGRLLLQRDAGRAAEALRRAGAGAEALGAVNEAAAAERMLRGLGVRTWKRGPAATGEDPLERLTQREREVALLVAEGASNPEIAASLFLSRKTVERHVSNMLAKVGVRNRAQLAGRLHSQD